MDLKALRDPNLRKEQYIAGLLSDASEQDIDEYQQGLKKLRNRASTDLQQSVYQNRTQFVKISKEAERLKEEMRALRNLMSELKTSTTALRTTSSQGPSTGFNQGFPSTLSKRDKRSSVADRTAMWNSQLQVGKTCIHRTQFCSVLIPSRHYGKMSKGLKSFYLLSQVVTWSRMPDTGLSLIMQLGRHGVPCKYSY